jgi:IS5 family transposase
MGQLLASAIGGVKNAARRAPDKVTTDRGYGDAKVDRDLSELRVRFVAIISKGRQGVARRKLQHSPGLRKLIKWRTRSEGRISALKRSWADRRALWTNSTAPRSGAGTASSPTTARR